MAALPLLIVVAVLALAAVGAAILLVRDHQGSRPATGTGGHPMPTAPSPTRARPIPVEERESVGGLAAVAIATRKRAVEVPPERAGVDRRQFLNCALLTTALTSATATGMGMVGFLWPRLSGGFGADIDAGDLTDLLEQAVNPDGSITPVFVPAARAYIVPAPDPLPDRYRDKSIAVGGAFAIYQRCTHLGCRVPWCQTSQGFECPCHGSKFSAIGEYFTGPAPRSLDRFVIGVTDRGRLVVKTGTIIQTPRLAALSVPYPRGPLCVG